MDSPTIQSPTPQFFRPGMVDDRFKVPTMPMGMGQPGPSQMRPEFYQQGQLQQVLFFFQKGLGKDSKEKE